MYKDLVTLIAIIYLIYAAGRRLINLIQYYLTSPSIETDRTCTYIQDTLEEREDEPARITSEDPPPYEETLRLTRTNFRGMILRRLRESCHIDDWENVSEDRRVIKRKVIRIIRELRKDIRDVDIFMNADAIVELFFMPTGMDIECRKIRYSTTMLEQQRLYAKPIWIGWHMLLRGRLPWVYPSTEPR